MTEIKVYAEWQKLCNEHTAARDAHFNAFAVVNQKFVAIGQGTSRTNPTNNELSEFEITWKAWEDVKNKMSEFVKKHA
jgi:phage-related protein